MKGEFILCAAVWCDDGNKHEHQPRNIDHGFVVCGRRHHNCFMTIAILKGVNLKDADFGEVVQGFITSEDRFVTRKEASVIAFREGQSTREDGCLFSEDLY